MEPGSGSFHVPGPAANFKDTAVEPDPKETRPANVTATGAVAGGGGVHLVV